MPGVVITVGSALLVALSHSKPGERFPSLAAAGESLAAPTLGGALVLSLAVVLSTVMTQAFEFEMIKLLEGYWSDRWLMQVIRRRRVTALAETGKNVRKSVRQLERQTMKSSIQRLSGGDKALKDRLKVRARAQGDSDSSMADPEADYLLRRWRTAADPAALRRLEALERITRSYPDAYRTMPTKLGNVLRASEDRLKIADGGDLEGFILRNYDRLPDRLIAQVGDFRTRLNMYCTLVLAWTLLAVAAVSATWKFDGLLHVTAAGSGLFCLTLAAASYMAAISSARGYGSALLAADEHVTQLIERGVTRSGESSDDADTDQDA